MAVNFVDLPGQFADIEGNIIKAISDIIHRGAFVGGPVLAAFETKLAQYAGTKFAIGCSDGTNALVLALLAAGIKKGDKAIVPVNTFIATANAVVHAGGEPQFVDCDKDTYLIDLNQTEKILKKSKTKFILPVHLYGNPCPMKQIMDMAQKYNVTVIEDNAQAIGAEINGQKTGCFGAASGISFYPAKNLGAFGQGGAVLTSDEKMSKTIRMYIEQGQGGERYYHDVVGYNARLDTIQACILSLLLDKLDGFNAARLRAADWYASRLPADRIQKRTANSKPVYHLFEYRCDSKAQRDKLSEAFKAAGIGFGYHYPVPIHKQKAYQASNNLSFPVSEQLAETLISLPIHPGITKEQVDTVCNTIESL